LTVEPSSHQAGEPENGIRPGLAPQGGTDEAVYRLLVENSYDLVGELDAHGDYVYVNPSYATGLGYAPGEILGRSVFDFIHPQDREKARGELGQYAGTTVLRFAHQSGVWKWFDCSFRQYNSAQGFRTALVSRDISARREAEIKFEVLASLGTRLSGCKALPDAARILADAAQELCGWDAFSLDAYDGRRDLLDPVLMIDEVNGVKQEFPTETGGVRPPGPFARQVIRDGACRISRKGNAFDPGLRAFGDKGRASASLLFAPVAEGSEIVGLVSIQSYRINAYSFSDLKLLQVLAGHCAGTLGRLRAVEKLRESQARFEAFMEHAPGAAWIKDDQGRYVYANQAISSFLGRPRDSILGRTDRDVQGAQAAGEIEAVERAVQASGESQRGEVSRENEQRWFLCRFPFAPVKSGQHPHGQYIGGLAFDVTDLARMQRSLEASKNRFQTLFEAAPVGLGVVRGGELLLANGSYRRLFGVADTADLAGRAWLEDVAPSARAGLAKYFEGASSGPACLGPAEVPVRRNGGGEFPCIMQIAPVELEDGPAHLVFVVDVSEQRALEARLFQAQKIESIGRLAGGIAHHFANVLTVIQGHAQRLERGLANPVAALDEIVRAAQKGSELTRQLLAFSRKQAVRFSETDLNQVIEGASAMARRIAGAKVAVRAFPAPRLPLILADRALLEQMIVNLAAFCRESMPGGGNLTFRTEFLAPGSHPDLMEEWRQGAVQLVVEDNGPGLAPEDLSKIFEPFFETQSGAGAALGLATAYGIVQQHLGLIRARSERGRGTVFEILLPAAGQRAALAEPERKPAGATILIIEDSADLRAMLRDLLADEGYRALEAAGFEDGLKLFDAERGRIALLVADVCLADGNGRELVRRVRAAAPQIKAILTTSYDPSPLRETLHLEEGEFFLPKPFQTGELLEAVGRLLKNSPQVQ